MKLLTLEEIIDALEGTCDRVIPGGSISRVTIDSRKVKVGDLFIAIRGERFDGHDFVNQAFASGALATVVSQDFDQSGRKGKSNSINHVDLPAEAMLIRVDDPVAAMGRLARYYRRSILSGSATVVAVTGSNGKTTTKTMISHILGRRWKGKASIKSFNNAIGVPLTLLSAEAADSFVICEVGTNAPGEIAGLAQIIEPEIAVITGVSEAHLAGLGSLEKIAEEKLSLLNQLKNDGCAVVNMDSEIIRWTMQRDRELSKIRCVSFGRWEEADLRLTDLRVGSSATGCGGMEFTVNDRFKYRLQVPGKHNAFNALAAIGVARRFGMDHDEIIERLATFELPAMRLQCEHIGRLSLINDAYNANPASLRAAVEVLTETPALSRRVLIVGDMRELGSESERLHREAAEFIARSRIGMVVSVGDYAKLMA